MIVLHYGAVLRASAEFSGKMTETAEQMALLAYSKTYGDTGKVIRGALSDTWAYRQVVSKAADKGAVKNASFLHSSFLKENDRICLVLTYQVKSPFPIIRIPHTVFLQKLVIRGWVGKNGSKGADGKSGESSASDQVYVTDTGSVYHTSADCTHLKLTLTKISQSQLKTARNYKGGKYRRCPRCRHLKGDDGTVIVNPYGDSYHTSASCPGLKRSVHSVHQSELSGMRECADCRKKRGSS